MEGGEPFKNQCSKSEPAFWKSILFGLSEILDLYLKFHLGTHAIWLSGVVLHIPLIVPFGE